MSSDPKDILGGLGEGDWDSALDDWERNSFTPSIAPAVESKTAAEPATEAAEAPPPDMPDLPTSTEETPIPAGFGPEPATKPANEQAVLKAEESALAAEKAAKDANRVPSAPPSARGGLNQLFSRASSPSLPGPLDTAADPIDLEQTPSVPPAIATAVGPFLDQDNDETLLRHSNPPPAPAAAAIETEPGPLPIPDPDDDATSSPNDDATSSPNDNATSSLDDLPDEETRELPALRAGAAEKPQTLLAPIVRDPATSSDLGASASTSTGVAGEASELSEAEIDGETLIRTSLAPRAPAEAAPAEPSQTQLAPTKWLDAKKTEQFLARITWLEEEARSLEDPVARGRALLACSELAAIVGDVERALAFANEAKAVAPSLPLAGRQARMLLPRDTHTTLYDGSRGSAEGGTREVLVDALDAEASDSPTSASRVHATLLAADVLRVSGDGDAAIERWESACKLEPSDPRAYVARAAIALAQTHYQSDALRIEGNSELLALDKAVTTALRLRGVERPAGVATEDMPINDGLRHARNALADGDVVVAAQSIGEIANVPEVAYGALWLSAAIGATHIASRRGAGRSLKTLAGEDDVLAKRQLAARGLELGDLDLVTTALGGRDAFGAAERAVITLLADKGDKPPVLDDATIAKLAGNAEMLPLADAVSALAPVIAEDGGREAIVRSHRVSGKAPSRALTALGRLLAAKEPDLGIDEALETIAEPPTASAAGVQLESAVRGKRWAEVSEALSKLTADPAGNVAAAIVAERAGDRERARDAWRAAAKNGAGEGITRIAAELDDSVDLGAELLRIADEQPDGLGPAVLRLEAAARKTGHATLVSGSRGSAEGGTRGDAIYEKVHRAAPGLGIGAFLAERVARRKGDVDEVLKWIAERRNYANDPFEGALDAVREALLVADRDAETAARRLEEAWNARPDDVALRELFERLAVEPPDDRGAWREKRAAKAVGPAAALLWIEAAREHERAGNLEAMLKAARAAIEANDNGLSGPMRERAEEATGDTTRQTDELMEITKTSTVVATKREALERLADLDAFAKKDPAAAMLWHRAILEDEAQHLPSLRWVEQSLITEGRDDELSPIFEAIAIALDGTAGGEVTAHAQHAARLRAREGAAEAVSHSPVYGEPTPWERTENMARLAASQPEASLWSLRQLNAHARLRHDDEALLKTTQALLERTQRAAERGTLLLRASESAARLGKAADARNYLEQAASEDPGDVVTWGFLAEVRERAGQPKEAAEACEALARTSVVPQHQLLAWHDAAKIWADEVKDNERSMTALEAAAEIDPTYADVFPRLSALYAERRLDAELAHLLERRLEGAHDDDERVALQVELARAFAEMGELAKASTALASALEKRPDHTTALSAMADVASREGDWAAAESAYVRLARLLPDPEEQRTIYEKLGDIYATHAPNLSRAEVALKEVLKRTTEPSLEAATVAKLVDVYKRQGDVGKAVEQQQILIEGAADPEARLLALIELAKIHEQVGRDPRKSEQVLDSARKEFPTSVVALRAMAEFYSRQKQMPAMQILLDRAAGDARRAFAQGRFVPALFEVLHAAFELRGKRDAAKVTAATLAAVQGRPSELSGAEARAVDPRLDDLLAPELMSAPLRQLFVRAGDALDAVAAVDLRTLKAVPLQPGTPIGATVGSVATVVGLGALQILVSPNLGRVAIPLATNPPTLLVGEPLARAKNEAARMFVVVRALKMILSHASVMVRASETDIAALVGSLFTAFNPGFQPQGLDAKRHTELTRRIIGALPRTVDPTVGVVALEAAGFVGNSWTSLAAAGAAWANRAALLAVGDPNAALDGLAWVKSEDAAPTNPEERAAWIARNVEARDLMTFSVTDAYAEARDRLGLA